MIPRSTVEISLELVGERFARSDGTLFHARYTIHPWGLFLKKSMPVKRRPLLWSGNLIMNSDLDGIAPVCLNCWTGKLVID